jgi:hypothetical protein
MAKKKSGKLKKILNSEEFQGRNSCKNQSFALKRQLEQLLLTTKQYNTSFNPIAVKMAKKVRKTVNDSGRPANQPAGQRQNIIRPVFRRAYKNDPLAVEY